ncbi:hypothetical protein GGI35DRAFT_493868 [Trichoderma velutinum]
MAELSLRIHRLLTVTLNIESISHFSRNLILLLCALDTTQSAQGHDQANMSRAIDTIIHVWYSAFLTRSIVQYLEENILPLLEQVHSKLDGAALDTVIDHTWNFSGGSSIQVSLPVRCWKYIVNSLRIPWGLNHQVATSRLQRVTLDVGRRDARDYHYSKMTYSPHFRMVHQRFREDGMLLPFGDSRLDFVHPNPLRFPASFGYNYTDFANPLAGWNILEVEKMPWAASNDLYGKLNCFLKFKIAKFLLRLGEDQIVLSLLGVNIRTLPHHLGSRKYDRIEVSNVCGRETISIRETFQLFSGHLLDPTDNPHATLITFFVNIAKEADHLRGHTHTTTIMFQIPLLYDSFDANDPKVNQIFNLVQMPKIVDDYFAEYMKIQKFEQNARESGMEMKSQNTAVDKWPTRPKGLSDADPSIAFT